MVFPSKLNIFLFLFLGAWLVGWAFGEVMAIRQLGEPGTPDLFLIAWLTMWTVGGAWAIYTWLWMIAGKQLVEIRPGSLVIKKELFGFGVPREFDLSHVKNFRVSPESHDRWELNAGKNFLGMADGPIAFDYGAKTYRFGGPIDEAEAGQILTELSARLPAARPAS